MAEPFFALSGYEAHGASGGNGTGRLRELAVPSLLRSLLSEHLDPGYAAAASRRELGSVSRAGRLTQRGWEAIAALLIASVFAVAVAQARSLEPGERQAQQVLAANVRAVEDSAGRLAQIRDADAIDVDTLRKQRLADDVAGRRVLAGLDALSLQGATTAVVGPGLAVVVTEPGGGRNLSDASKQRVSGSRQIILDRDLQLVVNSLWACGAEAIAIGDVRIGPNVTVRQAGGAILVDNTPVSSPYHVRAIGPPRELREAFDRSPGLYRLRLLEASYGVAVRVDTHDADDVTLPAGSVRDVRFAEHKAPS